METVTTSGKIQKTMFKQNLYGSSGILQVTRTRKTAQSRHLC
jgi:hypothetical protein